MPYVRYVERRLKERVTARAAELGKTLPQVLAEANMGHDTLDKIPPMGRRTETLDRLARALDWSIAEVMGLEVFTRIGAKDMMDAYDMAERVIRQFPNVPDAQLKPLIFEEAAAILSLFAARRLDGLDITADYKSGLEQMLLDRLRRDRRFLSQPGGASDDLSPRKPTTTLSKA